MHEGVNLHVNLLAVISLRQFGQAGVQDDDLVVLVSNPSSASAPARSAVAPPSAAVSGARAGMRLEDIPGNATPELWLAIIELNPGLLDVVRLCITIFFLMSTSILIAYV